MHIGVDFDNTIVCYNRVFHKVALERGLIPDDIPVSKNKVRDYLREIGKEDEWTKLQGLVYGTKMDEVEAFEGVFDFLCQCRQREIRVSIISHKTGHPYLGPKYNLHLAALRWMEMRGFFNFRRLGLARDRIFLELTRADKIKRVIDTGCTHFIDDLPKFLSDAAFPQNVTGILFDPENNHKSECPFLKASSWDEISENLVFASNHEQRRTGKQ